jgi:hypothetical protein
VLDSLRGASEKDAQASSKIKGLNEAPTFSTLLSITSRMVEVLVKKGLVSTGDE